MPNHFTSSGVCGAMFAPAASAATAAYEDKWYPAIVGRVVDAYDVRWVEEPETINRTDCEDVRPAPADNETSSQGSRDAIESDAIIVGLDIQAPPAPGHAARQRPRVDPNDGVRLVGLTPAIDRAFGLTPRTRKHRCRN